MEEKIFLLPLLQKGEARECTRVYVATALQMIIIFFFFFHFRDCLCTVAKTAKRNVDIDERVMRIWHATSLSLACAWPKLAQLVLCASGCRRLQAASAEAAGGAYVAITQRVVCSKSRRSRISSYNEYCLETAVWGGILNL